MNVSLPLEGHNVAYRCKGIDQSTSVCEYEVNLSTNKKVITKSNTDISNIVCEYDINPLTNDKVIKEIQNFYAKW